MLHPQLSDREIERVLAGQQPYGRPDLADVAYFVARLRALGDFERTPPMSEALRAQLSASPGAGREAPVLAVARRPRLTEVPPAEDAGADHVELTGLEERREARQRARSARLRWRVVGAAAMVVMLGGVAVAGWLGGGGQPTSEPDSESNPIEERETSPSPPASDDRSDPPAEVEETEPATPPTSDDPVPADDEGQSEEPGGDPATAGDIAPALPEVEAPSGQYPWPPECTPGDMECWWDHFNRGGGDSRQPDGGGSGD